MDGSLPEITGTITDTAGQILLHSFAIHRVDASTAAKIRAAYRAAVSFFHETTTQLSSDGVIVENNKRVFLDRYRRVNSGNLYGYNIPLQSKELFRTWYDSGSSCNAENDQLEKELEYFRHQQPWPSNEFCVASFHLAKDLHRLLSECLRQINTLNDRGCSMSEYKENGGSSSVSKPSQNYSRQRKIIPSFSPPRKRLRVSSEVPIEHFGGNAKINKDDDWHPFRPSRSPLDFFFYHNRVPNAVNCSEHVDRGALVVVCLTDVPGLEVQSLASQNSSFVCPEVLVHNANLYRERTDDPCHHELVCIMAGDQLSQLLSSSSMTRRPHACVHRVRNPLKRARLSISYELRLNGL